MASEFWLFFEADYHIFGEEGSIRSIEIKKAFEVIEQRFVIPFSEQTLLETVSINSLNHIRRLLDFYEVKQSHKQDSITAQSLCRLLCIDDRLLLGP